MNKRQLADLLKKYLSGNCTEAELSIVNEWYEECNEQDDLLLADDGAQAEEIKQRIFAGIVNDTQNPPVPTRRLFSKWYIQIAAAAVVLFFLKIVVQDFYSETPANAIVLNQVKHIVNKTNTLYKQVLPDRSVVWLSPKSTLTFPSKFDDASRNVEMSGECYFEVTKNPKRPFIIQSGSVVTKVWGTSFKVVDRNLNEATVTVVTGKVSVSKKSGVSRDISPVMGRDEVLLLPNQQVTYQHNTNTLYTAKNIEMSAMQRYRHFNLSFENEKLADIVVALNNSYKSDIKINNNIDSSRLMNADFNGLNLPEILETLETSLQVTYVIKNETILLTK